MSETIDVQELECLPAGQPRSYLQTAAHLLTLAEASQLPETKVHYTLLASMYQKLADLSAKSGGVEGPGGRDQASNGMKI